MRAKSLQPCPSLCNPIDHSPPGSSVHGILQARILDQVAISFSRASSQPRIEPRSPVLQADSLLTELSQGSPFCLRVLNYHCQKGLENCSMFMFVL